MVEEPRKCQIPKTSGLKSISKNASYADAFYVAGIPEQMSVLNIYLTMVNNTPSLVNCLLQIRNKLVKCLGLQDVGKLGNVDSSSLAVTGYIAEKLDIFHIESISDNEMILRLDDKHLDIRLSVLKENMDKGSKTVISTLVFYHNLSERVYMCLIAPFHKIVIKRLMKALLPNNSETLL